MASFEQDRFRYCASAAQTWFQTSIVYLAAIEIERRRSSKKPTMDTEFFFFFMVELARFLVDSLLLWKSPWRWTKYWLNKATCYTSIWNNSSRHDFLEFIYFVTDGSFTADGGLLQPTGVVNATPKMPWEDSENICEKMATKNEWTDLWALPCQRNCVRRKRWTEERRSVATSRPARIPLGVSSKFVFKLQCELSVDTGQEKSWARYEPTRLVRDFMTKLDSERRQHES